MIFLVLNMIKQNGFDLIKNNLSNTYQFYRETLNNNEIQIYDILVNSFIDYKSIIQCKGIDLYRIESIFNLIKLDHPLLFYVESLNIKHEGITKTTIVYPKYRFDKDKANRTLIALLSKVKSILVPLTRLQELNKEKSIHDFFCENIYYDMKFTESSYECVGPLLFNKGVCEGISKAVKLLCDYSGLRCIVLHGNAIRSDDDVQVEAHTWNKIQIDNCFYNLDVTFDLTISVNNLVRYDYFNLSDYEILRDHKSKDINRIPCTQSRCYYSEIHLTFNSKTEIKKYFKYAISNNMKNIIIKVSAGSKESLKEKDIINCLNEVLVLTLHFNHGYQYSFNHYQGVIQIELL